jgi:hypothetical protein
MGAPPKILPNTFQIGDRSIRFSQGSKSFSANVTKAQVGHGTDD